MKLFDLLTRGAALAPDKEAAVHGDKNITYRDLLVKTNVLARYLENLDFPSGSRVAVLFEKA